MRDRERPTRRFRTWWRVWPAFVALLFLMLSTGGWFLVRIGRPDRNEAFRQTLDALDRKDWPAVSAGFQTLEDIPEARQELRFLRAVLTLRSGNPQKALNEFAKLDRDGPFRLRTLVYAGECYYQLAEYADALRCFSLVLQEAPDHAEAHRWLAAVYYDLGGTSSSAHHLQKLIAIRPDDFSPHLLMAEIFRDKEDYRSAVNSYEQALQRNPKSDQRVDVVAGMVQALIELHEFEKGLKALSSLDASAATDVLQAECYLGLGELETAEEALQRAARRGCDDVRFWSCQARLAMQQSLYEQVISSASRVVKQKEQLPEMLYLMSLAHRRLGNQREADRLQIQSEEASRLSIRLVDLSRLAEHQPNDPAIRDELAELYAQLGNQELARRWKASANACRKLLQK